MHSSSLRNMEIFIEKYLDKSQELKILDIGSQDVSDDGINSYKPLFHNPRWKYFGCDLVAGKNVDIVLNNIYHWKDIKHDSVDVVISGQAFEHVEFFWATMLEIYRVLKAGGICCIIAPSAGKRHRYPLDCWRFYEDGLSAMAKYAHLDAVEVQTQRTRFDFAEFDPDWQDSVLICKKPKSNISTRIKMALKHKCCHFLTHDIFEVNRKIPHLVRAQLFLDVDGKGYNEEDSVHQEVEILEDNIYSVVFDLKQFSAQNRISNMRFDPTTEPVEFRLVNAVVVYSDGSKYRLEATGTNGAEIGTNHYAFHHNDPNIDFHLLDIDFTQADFLIIHGEAKVPQA